MKKSKFQSRLFFYNVLFFVLILMVVMGFLYYYLANSLRQRALNDFETLSNKTAEQYNNLVYNMDKTALQIAANPNLVAIFSTLPKDSRRNYFIEEPLVANSVVKLLNSYNFKRDSNTRICLYTDYNDFVYSATTMTTVTAVENYFDNAEFQAVKAHFDSSSIFSMLRPPGRDILNDSTLPSPDYFAIIREIKDYSSNSQKSGYVEVQQSVSRVDGIFGDLGGDCYAAVLDNAGNTIYQSPSLEGAAPALRKRFMRTVEEPLPQGMSRQGQDYFCSYWIAEVPLNIVFMREGSVMIGPLRQFSVILVLAMAMVLMIVILSEQLLVKRLTKPLVTLSNLVNGISIDNMKLEIHETEDSDELQQLGDAFNRMFTHLRIAMDSQLIAKTNELKSHLFALQSQMNPHFIYNILAIISIEAENNPNTKITTICSRLSKLLHYSASMGDGFCSVSQELEHAVNYMELMKQRYEELFEYTVCCSSKISKVRIPKLIVQPICENCFKHAFSEKEDGWRVTVTGEATETGWSIAVEDNGSGCSPDFLERFEAMRRAITVDNVKDYMEGATIGGLTLPNIFMRLKLCYGEDFICTVENTGHGSKVTLGGGIQ